MTEPKENDDVQEVVVVDALPIETHINFKEFLETKPQNHKTKIRDLWEIKNHTQNQPAGTIHICTPELYLHCPSEKCSGNRYFRFKSGVTAIHDKKWPQLNTFFAYQCSNCLSTQKQFSLHFEINIELRNISGSGFCTKFGEIPAFGPTTPPRLLRLFGKERENFQKGRRCESQGMGIAAFSYYRRIVENQKNAIFDEIIRVSEKINAPSNLVELIKSARNENQFSNALEKTKDAMPPSLLVNGHNPLTLLHVALSDGLHAQSDEECLEIAQDIRVILSEFADRLGQALNDEHELKQSVNRLMGRQSKAKAK